MNIVELRAKFRAGRKKRDLTCEAMAEKISEQIGIKVTRAALTNVENGRSLKPSPPFREAMVRFVEAWDLEDSGRAQEDPAGYQLRPWYEAKHRCHSCKCIVPGPGVGAAFCLRCGSELSCDACLNCGRSLEEEFKLCPYCGEKVELGGA